MMSNLGEVLIFFVVMQVGYTMTMECSDKVTLSRNVNGKLTIEPGHTVLPGTNVSITCRGIDAIPANDGKINRPLDYAVIFIDMFGPGDKHIKTCNRNNNRTICTYTLPLTNDTGSFKYSCRFASRVHKRFCTTAANLTVTKNECLTFPLPCNANATCRKTRNSISCSCNEGFSGDGQHCEEIEDCSFYPSLCDKNGYCVKVNDSLNCKCNKGYSGNGTYCSVTLEMTETDSSEEIEDCSFYPSLCDKNGYCVKVNDSLNCKCNKGYSGNGTYCSEMTETDSSEGKTNTSTKKWIIIGAVLGSFLIIAAIVLGFYFHKHRKDSDISKKHPETSKRPGTVMDNLGVLFPAEEKSPRRKLPSIRDHNKLEERLSEESNDILSYICVLDDWEIERDNLRILQKKLGGGQFGLVKKGLYTNKIEENSEITVAVKMLKDAASAADHSDLLMELFILKEVNKDPHPNVIQLIGAVTSKEPILVITEFCSHGNLRNLLRHSRINRDGKDTASVHYVNVVSTLSQQILIQIAIDIANGMNHLAAKQFVHRDLSARNVLVSCNYEAKVSDFGLARPITGVDQMYVKSNRNLLPVKWMALESLTHGIFRTSSDVWAFGVLLWEITTLGEEPYPDISPFDTLNHVASGNRMNRPPQCSEELYEMMMKCWEANQENRPNFPHLHDQLTKMLGDKQQKLYINIVEDRDSTNEIINDRRESVQSLSDLRYTNN